MTDRIRVCRRGIPCIDCDDQTCWHTGQLIANCPLPYCNRTGEQLEDCETCELMQDILAEYRKRRRSRDD